MTPSTHDAAGRPATPGPHDGGDAATQHQSDSRYHVTTIVVACGPDCAHPGSEAVDISGEYAHEDATGMLLLIGDEDDGCVYLSVQDREPVVLTRAHAEQAGWHLLARANARRTRPDPTITHGPTDRGFTEEKGTPMTDGSGVVGWRPVSTGQPDTSKQADQKPTAEQQPPGSGVVGWRPVNPRKTT